MTQRQTWLDVLKGIGILTVVVAHISFNRNLVGLIQMFHMPLFFLAGGWLHDTRPSQLAYARTKARSVLLPYVCFLVILWPLELLMSAPPGAAWDWERLLVPMLFGGRWLNGAAGPLWFLTCYFMTQQLVHFLLRHCAPAVWAAAAAMMLACAYLAAWLFPGWSLPWSADVVLFAAPVYLIGYAARHQSLGRWSALWVLLTIGGAALYLARLPGLANTLDMKFGVYGIPLVTLASALAMVALLALLSQRIATSRAGRVLASFGAASMTILAVHQLVQLFIAKQLGIMQAGPRILGALVVCYAVHQLLDAWPAAARLFLGRRPQQVAA
jgi:polysaccharide biosynthesis protein PslL